MAVELLDSLPSGSYVFIDANIFIYGLNRKSSQCYKLIERCAREELTGVSLFEIVNEATHVLMLGEAFEKHLISSQKSRLLRQNFRGIQDLTDYWFYTQRILSLNLLLMATNEGFLRTAHVVRQEACLLTNDSMIVSCMREYGISSLATSDTDFERVNGITIYRPGDLFQPA